MRKPRLINDFQAQSHVKAATRITTAKEEIMPAFTGPQESEFTYGLRVFCSNYFYGDDCMKYCRPADDNERGHFVCDKNGNKMCRKGFEGGECKTATN